MLNQPQITKERETILLLRQPQGIKFGLKITAENNEAYQEAAKIAQAEGLKTEAFVKLLTSKGFVLFDASSL